VTVDRDVQDYIDGIDDALRPLFDRVERVVMAAYPDASITLSYKMPTFAVDGRRLHVGVWKHGVSLYGWQADRDGGFLERHPDLRTSTGTIRISVDDATAVTDDELRLLAGSALEP
jgi:uncharacterized protein YdhG (YjbR/CyaY superfamily)